MKVVIVGKGGREHALAESLSKSPLVTDLWICPGNSGMQRAGFQCVSHESPESVETFCRTQGVSLVVVGPEGMILSDLKERLLRQNIFCFAPDQSVARLESSKLFCKGILKEAGVPTASCRVGYTEAEALHVVTQHNFNSPLVVKADGLAQGKGVWVCESQSKAREAVKWLGSQFGYPLLLEECLVGPELSAFALCDGEDFVLLGTACDYKRVTPDPFSANTGGMGAYSPCEFINESDELQIHEIFQRTLRTLKNKKMPYQGFLFAGLIKTAQGLSVLEYNVRLGDPETQALLPRLRTDLAELIMKAVTHDLSQTVCEFLPASSVHVVATSQGYPGTPMNLGNPISAPADSSVQLYYAGVGLIKDQLVNVGGRVLGVTALGRTREEARARAYQGIAQVSFTGMHLREDIGI